MFSPLQCKIFLEVAYTNNISSAAEKMDYTQGAISHAIKRMEDEAGLPLFKRSKYGVTLTDEGNAILPLAKKIVEYSDKLDEQIASLRGLDSGHIRLGTYATLSMQFLPRVLKEFTEVYPGIQVELVEGSANEIETWLNEQYIDLALTSIQKNDTFEKICLFDEPMVAIFPKNAEQPTLTPDGSLKITNLKNYHFITPMMDKRIDPDILQTIQSIPSLMKMHVSSCDFISIMCLIREKMGISILPRLVTNDYRNDLNIYNLKPEYARTVGLGIRKMDELSLASRKFIEYICNYTTHVFIPANADIGIHAHTSKP